MCSVHNSNNLLSPTELTTAERQTNPDTTRGKRSWRGGAGEGERVQGFAKQRGGGGHNINHNLQVAVPEQGESALTSLTAASISSMDGPLMPSSV